MQPAQASSAHPVCHLERGTGTSWHWGAWSWALFMQPCALTPSHEASLPGVLLGIQWRVGYHSRFGMPQLFVHCAQPPKLGRTLAAQPGQQVAQQHLAGLISFQVTELWRSIRMGGQPRGSNPVAGKPRALTAQGWVRRPEVGCTLGLASGWAPDVQRALNHRGQSDGMHTFLLWLTLFTWQMWFYGLIF